MRAQAQERIQHTSLLLGSLPFDMWRLKTQAHAIRHAV